MDADVAIVGYGPVGMVTAGLLARAGHRVRVLERYAGLYGLPRAAIFDDETMRTFAGLGIAERLLPGLHVQRTYEWRNGAGELLLEHDFAERELSVQGVVDDGTRRGLLDAVVGVGFRPVRPDFYVYGTARDAAGARALAAELTGALDPVPAPL